MPEFSERFPTEEAAIDYFITIRYGGVLTCPHCGATDRVYRYKSRPKACQCKNCNNSFSPFKGTIFEKSTTSLRTWFFAIYLFLKARKGIPALYLESVLEVFFQKVTYKTAFRMFHQIRIAMQNRELIPFEGLVEMDETYFFGGKPRKRPPKLYHPATYDESKKIDYRAGDYKSHGQRLKRAEIGTCLCTGYAF